jgi:hypothetical protein
MAMMMIESVMRSICKIHSGVRAHEFQVFRGYDMSGATIHEVPCRTRSVIFGFSSIVVESPSLRRNFVISKGGVRVGMLIRMYCLLVYV